MRVFLETWVVWNVCCCLCERLNCDVLFFSNTSTETIWNNSQNLWLNTIHLRIIWFAIDDSLQMKIEWSSFSCFTKNLIFFSTFPISFQLIPQISKTFPKSFFYISFDTTLKSINIFDLFLMKLKVHFHCFCKAVFFVKWNNLYWNIQLKSITVILIHETI